MVGCRYKVYASYALEHPELVKVIAVAEPRAHRRKVMSRLHSCVPRLSSTFPLSSLLMKLTPCIY